MMPEKQSSLNDINPLLRGQGHSDLEGSPEDPLLTNLWTQLESIQPTIPDRLSIAVLESAGVKLDATGGADSRLARLVGLAGQKFLTDILVDAMHHSRVVSGQAGIGGGSGGGGSGSNAQQPVSTNDSTSVAGNAQHANLVSSAGGKPSSASNVRPGADRRVTLTLDDLVASLKDRGIRVPRPSYYR